MSENENRLREHPATRLAAAEQLLDLREAGDKLQAEPHAGQHGHRQIAVGHHGAVTMVLFVFDSGGELADHSANGLVTIHVLEGELVVRTAEQSYELTRDKMVVLQPGVRHSLHAKSASRMLLTVHRTAKSTPE